MTVRTSALFLALALTGFFCQAQRTAGGPGGRDTGRGSSRDRASSRQRNRIPEWIPQCFEISSVTEMVSCIRDNAQPQCFEGDGSQDIQDIVDCVDALLPDEFSAEDIGRGKMVRAFHNATRSCLDPYVDCVNNTIQDRMSRMPSCVRHSLRNLTHCARQHRQECRANCSAVQPGNPFEDINKLALFTCDGIEQEVVAPACGIIDCCEPCVEHFRSVMECMVNDLLNHTGEECTFDTCVVASADPSPEIRFLRSLDEAEASWGNNRELQDSSEDDDDDEALSNMCLEFIPGLTGNDAEELGVRVPYFMPCLTEEYVAIVEERTAETTSGAIRKALWLSLSGMLAIATLALTFFAV